MSRKNNSIVLLGGGGHCKSVIDTIVALDRYSRMVVTDEVLSPGTEVNGVRVVGTDIMLPELIKDGYNEAFITVGSIKSSAVRRKVYGVASKFDAIFPVIIDKTAIVSDSAEIGNGTFIGKNASVNTEVLIGNHVIINTGVVIEHECRIGGFSHIAVGAVICGGCNIGSDVFVGANATVIQGVKVGMNSIIGAGSIVLADVPAGMTVTGVWGMK